jgi:hypothetical protein
MGRRQPSLPSAL